jgi:GGDEF domain-containing protein
MSMPARTVKFIKSFFSTSLSGSDKTEFVISIQNINIAREIYTIVPSDESTIDDFIRNADKALYMAKKTRNCSISDMQQ